MSLPKELTTVTPLSKTLALIMFTLLPIIAFFMGMQYQEMQSNLQILLLQESIMREKKYPTPTPESTKTYSDQGQNIMFKKRQYEIDGKLGSHYSLPPVVTNISDSNLVGMSCSNLYYDKYSYSDPGMAGTEYGYYDEQKKAFIKVADSALLNVIKEIKSKNTKRALLALQLCKLEDSREIIMYELSRSESTTDTPDAYFAFVLNGNVQPSITIPLQTMHFSCYKPLQLTESGQLYYACGGGDSTEQLFIYTINLNMRTFKHIYHCYEEFNKQTQGYYDVCNNI